MTFKHKLSKRLAIIWDTVLVLGSFALFACVGEQPSPTSSPISSSTDQLPVVDPGTDIGVAGGTATVLFQESFEDNAFASRGWYDNTSMITTTAEHAPGSTRALELRYLTGATTPVNGGSARRRFPASPTVYVSYWVKYSSNWVGSGQAYHPHEFLIVSDHDREWDGPAQSWLVAYIEHNYQNGGIPRLQLQDNKAINLSYGMPPVNLVSVTENRSTSGCNGVVEANVVTTCFNMPPWYNDKEVHAPRVTFQPSAGHGYKGDWNHVEAYFQLNTIANGKGVSDGVMQYWFNGELIIDRRDILFRTAARPTILFDKFMIAPYIGDGSPVNQTMWVDNLTVATGRIASDSAPPPPPPPVSNGAVGTVGDLAIARVTDSSVNLSFTEVDDGTGKPASYFIRWAPGVLAWGSATDVTRGSCKVPVIGTTIGAKRTCRVLGLRASTRYQFQLVAFRGTLNLDAEFGELSNIATGTTAAKPAPVASVTITPATVSQLPNTSQQFAATLKDSSGNVLTGRAMTWSSSNTGVATVNASGLENSLAPGSATITVTSEGVRGTAAVTVTDPPPPSTPTKPGTVTNLAVAGVTDSSVTLSFTEVNDGAGAPADYFMRFGVAPMSWGSATDVDRGSCRVPIEGGTIGTSRSCTVSGLTPNTAYQFQLVAFRGTLNADAEFGGLSNVASGTTTASVAPPPPPPPPPSPSSGWPNEPAGLTLLSDYGFGDVVPATNQGDLLGQGWRIWRNTGGHGTLAQDGGAPQSPSGVFQVHYPIGWLSGYEPAMVEYNFNQPVTELYWGFWWKPSNPFQSDASGVNKIAFVWTPSGATDLIYFDLSPGPWRIRAMDNLMAGGGPRAGLRDEPNVTTTVITLGQWHRIEIYLKYSTGSLANGVLKWWVDGVLNGHYTNLKMVQDGGFDHLQFAPTYGGNTGDRKTQNDYYWYDHVRVSRGP